jgi:GNAT superfamily N-acetyltransferase
MSPRVVVRRLAPGDSLEDLTALLHRAYAELLAMGLRYVATHQTVEVTRQRVAEGERWVAEMEGRVVGTVTFQPAAATHGGDVYDRPDVASVHMLAVEPTVRRRGIGRALLERAESRARETGAAELALDTSERAAHLVALYRRWGYEVVGAARWPAVNDASVVMSKRLR